MVKKVNIKPGGIIVWDKINLNVFKKNKVLELTTLVINYTYNTADCFIEKVVKALEKIRNKGGLKWRKKD